MSMDIQLGYGKERVLLTLPDRCRPIILQPNAVSVELTGQEEVMRSLKQPIGSPRLCSIVHARQKIVIVTSDITRPVPSYKIIPCILEELNEGGIRDEDITIVFGLGSHRSHSEDEMRYLVGHEVYERIHCVDHNPKDCVRLGVTSRGTPVDVFRTVVEADIRICIGNIEYHYFAGYSGGMKAVMPGVSTREAIQANHSRMIRPEACTGHIQGNPVREDIDEVERFCPADFIVNVVLNEEKEIIRCVSGNCIAAHRQGCRFLDELYKVEIAERADIVVVSAGGFPKDINMYQAQKALDNASHAVKDGGYIIWLAACSEGLGEGTFEKWMTEHACAADMIEHIRQDFKLGGHKAAAIAMILQRAKILLVSELELSFVREIHLEGFNNLNMAMGKALKSTVSNPSIIVMPYGCSTLPEYAAAKKEFPENILNNQNN